MIHRLRLKFTVIAMISMSLVLMVIMIGINVCNYIEVIRSADEVLSILTSNDGEFPELETEREVESDMEIDMAPDAIMMPEFAMTPINPMDKFGLKFNTSPELFFESRFFSVLFTSEGKVSSIDTGRIFAIDSDTAIEYAVKAIDSDKDIGFIGDYRYAIGFTSDDEVQVVFYDCGRGLDNFRSFRNFSIFVSAAGLAVVLILIVSLSGIVFKPVVESYEKQKRFITDAGHEIKTPLAIINADSDVLEMDVGENNEWLSDIRKQTTRLTELTNELILLAKMEEGKTSLNLISANLSELVDDEVDSFAGVIAAENKFLNKSIESGINMTLDEKQIKQLISVLMSNAVKYSPENGSIDVKLSNKNGVAQLRVVNDTTYELTKSDMEHLFDRFYRPDKSRSSENGGHGIGLSIARAIVEAHGGKISSEMNEDKKFVIKINIPIK